MKYHQNIRIDGEALPAEYANREESNFFNEGKWRNFIEPLLPDDPQDRTFVEIGCNVGLFLKLATEYGFRNVVGIEADAENCAMARKYRDANGMSYKVLHCTVGEDFDWDELPVADVVLLANVHYYIHMEHFMPFLDRMFYKTIDCIVVSRRMRDRKHGHPRPDVDSIRLMFRDWEMVRIMQTSTQMLENDPHPRRVYGMLFRSRLQRQPIEHHTTRGEKYIKQQEFIDIIRVGREVELEDTLNWRYWVQRKQTNKAGRKDRWTDEQVRQHVQHRFDLVRSMMEEGMREPILVRPDRIGIDGGNRAAILKLLGYGSVIVRIV
jgi:SAM-dependent methyltransferase